MTDGLGYLQADLNVQPLNYLANDELHPLGRIQAPSMLRSDTDNYCALVVDHGLSSGTPPCTEQSGRYESESVDQIEFSFLQIIAAATNGSVLPQIQQVTARCSGGSPWDDSLLASILNWQARSCVYREDESCWGSRGRSSVETLLLTITEAELRSNNLHRSIFGYAHTK